MKKNLILCICFLLVLAGCSKPELFKANQIEEIRIEENTSSLDAAKIVTDREVVKQFIEAINNAEPDSIKFSPKWRILMTDEKGNVHMVFCTKHNFKYKGKFYKSEEDMEQILMREDREGKRK
ncbi:hypothetical protein [Parachryseolinea silvisoli]|uniref:hypothetical protein n=1 Tax=Parachryseolinea silvisoli TaxID=2873601 RepID=UPI0022659821|nr:hypothetical protein [Parachryseolinea silvisoli]MCD9016886.1 hypothetical protein [Parachryseolinea silvisoli]